jgi:uridine kinase
MDNYYKGPNFHKQNPKINYDQPEALNLDLFFTHLEQLKK